MPEPKIPHFLPQKLPIPTLHSTHEEPLLASLPLCKAESRYNYLALDKKVINQAKQASFPVSVHMFLLFMYRK